MKVEIWSDVVCPWCYIGKRRLERALSQFEHADEVEVAWRSFQLNPDTPARRLGASGVPFFVIDRRYGISGAQPAETFLQVLRTAYAAEDAAAPG